MSRLDYKTLHWGTEPTHIEELLVPQGDGDPVGELEAISYVTVKEGEPTVYRHEFSKKDGRFPYLLESKDGKSGKYKFPKASSRLIALGRVIDLEVVGGRCIYTPFLWVVTTQADKDRGGPVLLASRFGPIHAIEHRDGDPHIREHGIIN